MEVTPVPRKGQLTFNGIYTIISQKIELFMTTSVKTSSPIYKKNGLIKHCTMKTCGGVWVELHILLPSALDGGL
jgi:hypothetical protein